MRTIRFRTDDKDLGRAKTMLPSGRHIVDAHGTIHAPRPALTKRERAKIKRQNKAKREFISPAPLSSRVGAFFA